MKQLSTSQKLWFVFALNTLAVGLHFYLTSKHYNLRFGDAQPSLCNISPTFNCDAVAASRYSEILGFPLALWGAMTNLVLAVWVALLALVRTPSATQMWKMATGQGVVAIISVIMGALSLTQLHTYCLFCIAAYAISFLAFGVVMMCKQKTSPPWFEIFTNKDVWSSVASVFFLVWIIDGLYLKNYNSEHIHKVISQSLADWQVEPLYQFSSDAMTLTKGPEKSAAKVTIVEFADFLCPHCKFAAQKLDMFTKSHPDAHLTFLFFPLDGTCNAAIERPSNPRCVLAGLTYCAQKSGQGWIAHDAIFAAQEALGTTSDIDKILSPSFSEKGLNYLELKQCAESIETRDAVKAQAQQGVNAKIQGTPSIFVNGRYLPGGQNMEVLKAAYERAR